MESILSIVFLVAIYSLVYVIKSLGSKSADVNAKPLTGEASPAIEVLEPSVEPDVLVTFDAPARPVSTIVSEKKDSTAVKRRTNVHTVQRTTTTSAAPVATSAPVGNRVGLKNRFEAKRAFLYSEILKRKY